MKLVVGLFFSFFLLGCTQVDNYRYSSEENLQYLTDLANNGDTEAQGLLVYIYEGRDDSFSQAEAVKWYQKLAEKGVLNAQILLADRYLTGKGVSQNYPEAIRWYTEAANKNSDIAQFQLAKIYINGRGVRQDYNKAFKLLTLSANQNNSEAQILLASAYFQGQGVQKNSAAAKHWFGVACDNQNAMGCEGYKLLNMNGF